MAAEWALQTAIYDVLSADSTISSLGATVLDHPPQASANDSDAAYPFILIGDINGVAWDTDTETGKEAIASVHVWSRYRGMKEVKQLHDAIYSALNRVALTVTGYSVLDTLYQESDVFEEPDGVTRHGVIKFNVKYEAN